MRFWIVAATMAVLIGPATSEEFVGSIESYQCRTDCYLTVKRLDSGETVTARCAAVGCGPWNTQREMPPRMVGQQVDVVLEPEQGARAGGNKFSSIHVEPARKPGITMSAVDMAVLYQFYLVSDSCRSNATIWSDTSFGQLGEFLASAMASADQAIKQRAWQVANQQHQQTAALLTVNDCAYTMSYFQALGFAPQASVGPAPF